MWLVFALVFAASGRAPEAVPFTYTPAVEAALGWISADSMRGHLSFIASDVLAGRDTPSPGLEVAAEYIAAQFRRAGLEPAGDDGYFQTARFVRLDSRPETFEFRLESPQGAVRVGKDAVAAGTAAAFDLEAAVVVNAGAADLAGKVVIYDERLTGARMRQLAAAKPALIVVLDRSGNLVQQLESRARLAEADAAAGAPWIALHSEELAKAVDAGLKDATVTAKMQPAAAAPVKLHNVIGVLRGSDPALRDTYVLLTAHYDHIGVKPGCTEGDCIYNGANDDGSGTVSVIEIASALARLEPRPKRSIVFMTVFGEEEGGYGARYYTRHPVFPLAKTIADVNLEQVGRTDAAGGSQVGTATFTGFKFSDVPQIFRQAGALAGIKVYNTPDSDDFFNRSDNVAFAEAGIPAHTLCVAYEYPDYHAVGDSWEKIDYANMARVDRMIALGVLMLAEDLQAPRWNAAQSKVQAYLKAWTERHAE